MEAIVRDDLRRMALFTSGLAEMTRNRAEDLVRSWTHSGDVRREQVEGLVRDLLEWSAQNRKELTAFVRTEIQAQLSALGVASRRDVERLERRLDRIEETLRTTASRGTSTGGRRKTTAAKAASKRTKSKRTAKKTTRATRPRS
jgi:polyhydroxyalkanoate synthesis regulator phasin